MTLLDGRPLAGSPDEASNPVSWNRDLERTGGIPFDAAPIPVEATLTSPDPGAAAGHPSALAHEAPVRRTTSSASRAWLTGGLILWDFLVPVAVVALATWFESLLGMSVQGSPSRVALALGILSPVGLAVAGGYDHARRRSGSRLIFAMRLLVLGIVLSWVAAIAVAVAGWHLDPGQMLATAVILPAGWLLGRWACDRHPAVAVERVLLVGSGVQARRVLALARRHRERRLEVVGRVDPDPESSGRHPRAP